MNKLLFKTCVFFCIFQLSYALFSQTTLRVKIANMHDAVEFYSVAGYTYLSHLFRLLSNINGATPQITGARFSNLNLPDNTHITIIYCQTAGTKASQQSATKRVEIRMGNVATCFASPFKRSTRPILVTSTPWTFAAWTVAGEGAYTDKKNYCSES